MRLTGTLAALLVTQPALLVTTGCDSRVGDKYTGEPLLSIRGSVMQAGVVSSDLIPVLGFRDKVNGPYDESLLRVIDGHVTGEFPARFQIDFTQPPPDTAFMPPSESEPEGGLWTQGVLFMVPKNHPTVYSVLQTSTERVPDPQAMACDAGDNCDSEPSNNGFYTERVTTCESENHCKVVTYQCHDEPCILLNSTGDPALETSDEATRHRSVGAYAPGLLVATTYYDPRDIDHSYRAVYYCDELQRVPSLGGLDGLAYDRHGVPAKQYCTPTEKTGENFPEGTDIPWAARWFFVAYSKLDGVQFGGSPPLARGYNVIKVETVLSKEESVAAVTCLEDAAVTVIKELNAAYGTHYVPMESDPDGFPEGELWDREQALRAECPQIGYKWSIVPPSEPIEIVVGSPSWPTASP